MKYNPQQLHLQHNTFNKDISVAIIIRYDKKLNEWVFTSHKCIQCNTILVLANTVVKHTLSCKTINSIKKEKLMPIQAITIKGERYYKYGDSGTPYKNRSDAEKQRIAMYANGYRESKTIIKEKK